MLLYKLMMVFMFDLKAIKIPIGNWKYFWVSPIRKQPKLLWMMLFCT